MLKQDKVLPSRGWAFQSSDMPKIPDLMICQASGLIFALPKIKLAVLSYGPAKTPSLPDTGRPHRVFLEVNHACYVLSDPNWKAQYDGSDQPLRDEHRMTMVGHQTTPLEPSPETVPQSRSLDAPSRIPDFTRPGPVDYSLLPAVFRPDPIAEAYKKGKFHGPEAVRYINFLVGMDSDGFKPFMVDFLNFSAFNGLKRYHDPGFQRSVDQRCHAIGSGMKHMSWAEAGQSIKDALQRVQELRIGVIVVILRCRAHLLFPEDSVMKEAFCIVASLGYLLELVKKLRQRFEGIGPGRWDARNDATVLGAIMAHLDTMRDMTRVLERMKGLADDLALVDDDRPKRMIFLKWIGDEMTNWPRMSA